MQEMTKHEKLIEKRRLSEERREQERQQAKSQKTKKRLIHFSILFIILIIVAGFVIYRARAPGKYDGFAKCLAEKGAVMYGAIDWCKYTQEQASMFGKSFKYIDYKDYSEDKNIKITPTWLINGEYYERVQSFGKLSELTGCKI